LVKLRKLPKANANELTLVLLTHSPNRVGLTSGFESAPYARTLLIQVLTSASPSSLEKGRWDN
jgi:hypothetical protein